MVNDLNSMQVTKSLAMSSDLTGGMVCIRGSDIGTMFPLPSDKKMIVGRDPAVCQYVVSHPKVSRKHLEITYIGALNQYMVRDLSSNGTSADSTGKMQKNREYYLPPGAEIKMGSGDMVFKLR